MTQQIPTWKVGLLLVAAWLIFAAPKMQGCSLPVIGPAPPFKTDKLAALIVEESDNRTTAADAVFDAIELSVKSGGGDWRRLDKDQRDLSMDLPWVQQAWSAKGPTVPWIVAANARTGINQALPLDKDAAVKLVQGLGGK